MFASKSFTPRLLPRMVALVVAGALCLSLQGKARAAAALSTADREYVRQAAQEVLGEKAVGQMARDRAKHEDVKHAAEEQVTGSEKMEKELREFADKHNYALPGKDVFEKANEIRLDKVRTASDFDKQYVAGEIRDHQNMIDLFTKGADRVENADLKKWLEEKTTVLQAQLTTFKELQDKLDK